MSNEKPNTESILGKARELGREIAEHPAAVAYHDAIKNLEGDPEAQRLLTDYNRLMQTLAEKDSNQQPIEVEEKRRLQDLQSKVAMNASLSRLQMVQMDYLDLMRKVEEAMSETAKSS